MIIYNDKNKILIMEEYHVPVMVNEVVDNLVVDPDGVYVDLTFGGGGHSKAILSRLSGKGRLIALDQDDDSFAQSQLIDSPNFCFVKANYIFFPNFLYYLNIEHVDGIFADLGVSSYQIDEPTRGFSIRFDGPLDMRMNKSISLTAAKIVNSYPFDDIVRILKDYGEVKCARLIADAIIFRRTNNGGIKTTGELKRIILDCVQRRSAQNKVLSQVFQALRIAVNDELVNLRVCLSNAKDVLRTGGRMAVISYHSLEDRLVKRFFKFGDFVNQQPTDMFGNYSKTFRLISKKPIVASEEEIKANSRSHSAKLRICEKLC